MESLGFEQSHTLSNVRLAIGYTAVLACAAAAIYEHKVGFKEAKGLSTLAVGTYLLLNIALYCWGYFIEGQTMYVGRKDPIMVFSLFQS
jgi:signal peptidase complex subunit 2